MQLHGRAEKVEDRAKDQIEYCNEDKWVREKFEGEMAKRGFTSLMPPEAYTDSNFEWNWQPFVQQNQKRAIAISSAANKKPHAWWGFLFSGSQDSCGFFRL